MHVQKEEIEAEKQKLEQEINSLKQKKWKLIATHWKLGAGKKDANVSLYCFKDGIFESPESAQAMSDAEIEEWIRSRPKSANRLLLYVENGANDNFLRAEAALNASRRFDGEYSLMTLPSDMSVR